MQKYGIILGNELIISEEPKDGYKPIQYAEIPSSFNQLTQCVVQGVPMDDGSTIHVGIEIKDVDTSEDPGDLFNA